MVYTEDKVRSDLKNVGFTLKSDITGCIVHRIGGL